MFLSIAGLVILWSSLYSLLLHKWLLSNRKWIVVFLSFQLFSERKLYSSTSLIYFYCIAYRNTVSRRDIRVYSGPRSGFLRSPGQLCSFNRSPELWFGRNKDHWLSRLQYRQAPVHNPIILCNFYTYFLVHLSYWSWMKT